MSLPTSPSHHVTTEVLEAESEETFIGTDGKINCKLRNKKKNYGIVEKQRKPKKAGKIKIGEKLQV